MKKLLLIALLSSALQAQLTFDYEPELESIYQHPETAQLTDVLKVHNHTIKWIRKILAEHANGTHKLGTADRLYLESVSFRLADICNEFGYTH